MVEVTEKDQAVEEDGDPDDFTALESIKDDLEEGMVIMKLPVQANFVLRNRKRKKEILKNSLRLESRILFCVSQQI